MTTSQTNQDVLTHVDERGVATVTLNRAEKHNAFDDQLIAQLSTIFDQLGSDAAVRVVILAAEGRSFCAGADLNWMRRMAAYDFAENFQDAKGLAAMLHKLNTLAKPTIARVQGAAFGGGVGLVSCCDIAIASPNASFCLSEVKLGMVPATISPYVVEAIGPRASRRYFTTAERFDSATALRIGLISEIVVAELLDSKIAAISNALLANGPVAVTAAKQLVTEVQYRAIDQALMDHTSELIATIRSSTEGREGVAAFLEKRPANWLKTH